MPATAPAAPHPHQKHHLLAGQIKRPSKIASDSTSGQDYRSLRTYAAAKPNCYGTGGYATPCVMKAYFTLLTCNGKEYFCNTMADVVSHHIADKKHCKQDSHNRIYQIGPVGSGNIELMGKPMLYELYEPFQEQARQSCKYSDQQTDKQHKLVV